MDDVRRIMRVGWRRRTAIVTAVALGIGGGTFVSPASSQSLTDRFRVFSVESRTNQPKARRSWLRLNPRVI